MVADVMIFSIEPGKTDRVIRHFQDSIMRATALLSGICGMLLLCDWHTGRAIALLLWETERDRLAAHESTSRQLAPMLDSLVPTSMEHTRYDVSVQVEMTRQGRARMRGI